MTDSPPDELDVLAEVHKQLAYGNVVLQLNDVHRTILLEIMRLSQGKTKGNAAEEVIAAFDRQDGRSVLLDPPTAKNLYDEITEHLTTASAQQSPKQPTGPRRKLTSEHSISNLVDQARVMQEVLEQLQAGSVITLLAFDYLSFNNFLETNARSLPKEKWLQEISAITDAQIPDDEFTSTDKFTVDLGAHAQELKTQLEEMFSE